MQRTDFEAVFSYNDPLHEYGHDCPVRFEVWLAFATSRAKRNRQDVMLNAAEGSSSREVAQMLDANSGPAGARRRLAVSGNYVVVELTLLELVHRVMPMTSLGPLIDGLRMAVETMAADRYHLVNGIVDGANLWDVMSPSDVESARGRRAASEAFDRLSWLCRQLVAIVLDEYEVNVEDAQSALAGLFGVTEQSASFNEREFLATITRSADDAMVETVTLNRLARKNVVESRKTVKADAALAVFGLSCEALTWAILDSGIDAGHPAFRLRVVDGQPVSAVDGEWPSRVTATYDFTRVRDVLTNSGATTTDWERIEPELRVLNSSKSPPSSSHGTHVAGILGADWREENLIGICPDIKLWDIRVLDERGVGHEFDILAALQFLRWVNERGSRQVVAGANLSFSLVHEVANYSCGWTPVCTESDRLVRSGVVVVAAAGNAGFETGSAELADGTNYHAISITDPGNAESVITVGATHRSDPHRHGVSFFSGRGPTADGRMKPDLLAPGERIDGPIPNEGIRRMTGTSQAAPHVSGAAALLMVRYRELLGRPERVKEILCASATDLGREPAFQGGGLVDVLRAMQSI